MLLGFAIMLASTPAANGPASAETPKPVLICRESEVELGSHIRSGRRCKTAEEWRQEDARKGLIPPSLTVQTHRGDGAVPPPVDPERPWV